MDGAAGSGSDAGRDPSASMDVSSGDLGAQLSEFAAGGSQRKRSAPEMLDPAAQQQGESSTAVFKPSCSSGVEHEQFPAFQRLTATQRAVVRKMISVLDVDNDSVVLTDPLQPQGPIVYVTNAWQDMCGYTMTQAMGQNPRLTQGEGTDRETVCSMRKALTARQPCKVRIINYRGYNREPFWNCLSVHPIFFNNECVLFAARLQDYSHRLTPLVSLTPQQFCKAGDMYQMKVRLSDVTSAKRLSNPRIVEVTPGDIGLAQEGSSGAERKSGGDYGETSTVEEASSTSDDSNSLTGDCASSTAPMAPPGCVRRPGLPMNHVKRLGFGGLELEPEYLVDRLRHECASLAIPCQAREMLVQGAEVIRMELSSARSGGGSGEAGGEGSSSTTSNNGAGGTAAGGMPRAIGVSWMPRPGEGLRALLHVLPEDEDGTYSISLMRLVGDTFEFHALYRSLRERLLDLTQPTPTGASRSAMTVS